MQIQYYEKAYYQYTGQGDVARVSDAAGNTLAAYAYDAFGNVTNRSGTLNQPYGYRGYQYDAGAKLYYLNARYYDPDLARFISEDAYRGNTADPLSLNRYTYCSNNPIRYIDPSGYDKVKVSYDDMTHQEQEQYDYWSKRAGDESLTSEERTEAVAKMSELSYRERENSKEDQTTVSDQGNELEFYDGGTSQNHYANDVNAKDILENQDGHGHQVKQTAKNASPKSSTYVMVAYIAEKNGGKAVYSEKNIFGYGSYDQKVTVSINGITKTYEIGNGKDAKIINGKTVIDSETLKRDFGLSTVQATHQPGDQFNSEEHAAMAFALMYHQKSINEKQEYGAVLQYNNITQKYTFEKVVCSKQQSHGDMNRVDIDISNTDNDPNILVTGIIHTHWHPKGNLSFSSGDFVATDLNGLHAYLVNRNGEVLYIKQTKKGSHTKPKKLFKIK